jgi:hypothetical protein
MQRANGNAKLSEEQARVILAELQKPPGERRKAGEIAEIYGLAAETVRRLWRGENWAWLRADLAIAPAPTAAEAEAAAASLARLRKLQQAAAGSTAATEQMLKELQGESDGKAKP